MVEKRSKQYEWFKGSKNKNEKPDFKKQLKVFFKFFKIFLYISLFVFTMFGCVQIFTHKISNNVGQGIEFYESEKEVAPHVTTFEINKNNEDAISIYINSKKNVWVNQKEDKLLKKIHQEIATQGNGLKLQDAYKGVNEAFHFHFTGKKIEGGISDGSNRIRTIKDSNNNERPIVGSSKMQNYNIDQNISDTYKIYLQKPNDAKKIIWQEISFKLTAITPQEKFRLNIFKSFFNVKGIKTFFATNPKDKSDDYKKNYLTSWKTIIDYTNVSSTKNLDGWEFNKRNSSFIPSEEQGKNYIPIVTWGQAWIRGVGPFYGIFVYPIGIVSAKILNAFPFLDGWETFLTIAIVVFMIRAITFLLSFKGTMQQTKMQEMQSKKAIIDAKYAPYKGNKQMENRQKQEVTDLYKKEGISPLSSIGTIFLTTPFFLAVWRVIGSLPHIKSTIWLGINFSLTSYKELFAGKFQYLPLMFFAAFFAAIQQVFPRLLTKRRDKNRINVHQKEAMKKNNKTQNIMMVVFVVMSLIFQAGLQVYWITGGIWTIFQSLVTHRLLIKQSKNRKRKRI